MTQQTREIVETWKSVGGYEGYYEVSDLARVRSVSRKVRLVCNGIETTRICKSRIMKNTIVEGYPRVSLCKYNKHKHIHVHRLVARAFLRTSLIRPTVNHIDGDRSNSVLSNLEYITQRENVLDGIRRMKKLKEAL